MSKLQLYGGRVQTAGHFRLIGFDLRKCMGENQLVGKRRQRRHALGQIIRGHTNGFQRFQRIRHIAGAELVIRGKLLQQGNGLCFGQDGIGHLEFPLGIVSRHDEMADASLAEAHHVLPSVASNSG